MSVEPSGHTRLAELPDDPFALYTEWRGRAAEAGVQYPGAACLATVSTQGRPQARFVILHPQPDATLVFLTDSSSPKARAIAAVPAVAVAVYWGAPLELQIRIEGGVEPVGDELADEIFARRPRRSQITHRVSRQSEPTTLDELLTALTRHDAESEGVDLTRPRHWVGYRLLPERWEFWLARARRLHDRFLYTRQGSTWRRGRLSP